MSLLFYIYVLLPDISSGEAVPSFVLAVPLTTLIRTQICKYRKVAAHCTYIYGWRRPGCNLGYLGTTY